MPHLSLHTPAGAITLFEQDGAIVALDWGWVAEQTATPLLAVARDQLHAYFDGTADGFDLPLAPAGTAYRRRVWQALRDIPFGATRTYRDIVAAAGGSARSVGQANARNPIPILIPCHRVLAVGGLGGYSGGDGLATKRLLLAIERDRLAKANQGRAGRGRLPARQAPARQTATLPTLRAPEPPLPGALNWTQGKPA